jgi:hypothetical protein
MVVIVVRRLVYVCVRACCVRARGAGMHVWEGVCVMCRVVLGCAVCVVCVCVCLRACVRSCVRVVMCCVVLCWAALSVCELACCVYECCDVQ